MRQESDLNTIQAEIIHRLFRGSELRFSELQPYNIPSDQFSYHLRQLRKQNIIAKTDDGLYRLTVDGKNASIMLDKHKKTYIKQGFVAVRVVLARQTNGAVEYLMQRRTNVPFKGYIAEPGGKVLFGEDIVEAAKRNILAETGLICDMETQGLVHIQDTQSGDILQDKYFFVVRAKNPTGTLKTRGSTGENIWMNEKELNAYPTVHQGVMDILQIAGSPTFEFREKTFEADGY